MDGGVVVIAGPHSTDGRAYEWTSEEIVSLARPTPSTFGSMIVKDIGHIPSYFVASYWL